MPNDNTEHGELDQIETPDFEAEYQALFGPLDAPDAALENNSEEPETKKTEEKEEFITIGDEQIPLSEARELVSKGKDYTKKTQELAEQRRALDENATRMRDMQVIMDAWNSGDPTARQKIATAMMQEAGLNPTLNQPAPNAPEVPYEDLSDGEKFLYQQNQRLQQQLAHFENQNKGLVTTLESLKGYISDQQGNDQASRDAQSLSAELGVTVTAQELRDAAKRTGISDYQAAWLKENKQALKGLSQPREEAKKPNTPSGQTRTFDPQAPGMTADKIIRMLNQGFTPTQK